jgi:hypothetical protein
MCQLHNKIIFLLILLIALPACDSHDNRPHPKTTSQSETVQPLRVIDISSPEINAAEPAIAAGKDGAVFVVWVEHKANKEADLMIRQYDQAGNPKSETVRINPQPGQVKAWYGDPPTIKIGQDGTIYIGWTAKVEGSQGAANTLYLSASRNGGHSFESPVKVNDDVAPASHGMHSLAIDDSGRIYFAWLDERYLNSHKEHTAVKEISDETQRFEKIAFFDHKPETKHKTEPNAELYFSVSRDGGKTFSPNKKLAGDVCPCCKTSLLAASDNRIYVSWRQVLNEDFRHIAVASSTDEGNTFSAPVIVSDDRWQISACPVSGAALTEDLDKTLRISWFTAGKAGKPGIYSADSKDGGKTFSPRMLISEYATGGTPSLIVSKTKNPQIIWTEDGKVIKVTLSNEKTAVENRQEIASGELPVAMLYNEQIFVSFIENENEKRSIKLSIVK